MLAQFHKVSSNIGSITFYHSWKTNPGSCNLYSSEELPFYVGALSPLSFMALPRGQFNPNKHILCQDKYCLKLYASNGRAIIVKITDTCASCGQYDVDISEPAYRQLFGASSNDRLTTKWKFVHCPRDNKWQRFGS